MCSRETCQEFQWPGDISISIRDSFKQRRKRVDGSSHLYQPRAHPARIFGAFTRVTGDAVGGGNGGT